MAAGKSKVTPLEEGELFETKQMEATSGKLLPRHKASIESVLVVKEGACKVAFPDTDHLLESGDSLIIAADLWHQISGNPDFKAIHIMPKEIRFEFEK